MKQNIPSLLSVLLLLLSSAPALQAGDASLWTPANTDAYPTVGAGITSASEVQQTAPVADSRLEVVSSDARLVAAFERAKRQAMGFVFENDPVGPWYEAAEPGREAFCMRDTAHQAMGAHALGLQRHNLNMLRKFAGAVSESRDWCSLWEIDRYDRPAPVDYENDALFWYNLPASFDILDCCYRMFVWTGDMAYVNDPVFLNFYDRTVNDYVERWGLGPDQVMKRPRLLNVRGLVDPDRKFQAARGIPGYNEGDAAYVLGIDVLANQYDAYVAYARIQEVRRERELAAKFLQKAADLRAFLTVTWWNTNENAFYARLNKDYQLEGRSRANIFEGADADIADPDAAYARLIDRAQPGRSRWDYPEVPFSWIGDFVNGTMGITLVAAPAGLSSQQGYWVAAVIRTVPRLGNDNEWTELRNLPVRSSDVTVRHERNRKTILTNQRGPAVIWQAAFDGAHPNLMLNGRPQGARSETNATGRVTSSIRVTISGGAAATVEIPE